jgi:pilus assembly protein CpaF
VLKFARLIAQLDHRSCDTTHPLCDCMLNAPGRSYDRSRVNITLQPISLYHPTITVRKFSQHMLGASDMVRMGSMDARCAELLEACVRGRMNMLVIGGTGSGKTSLLNVLSEFIPDDQRIITIEDTAELRLSKSNLITMQARKANGEGVGAVTVREIFQNALRQRPDRIIVGECRGGEVIDMLEAMSTGHDGSLTTLHANDARESVLRVDVLASMDGMRLPVQTVNEHFALAVDLIVTTARLADGSRKVVELMEVGGYDHETGLVSMAPLLKWKSEGMERDERGAAKVVGSLVGTGSHLTPAHVQRLRANGVSPDPSWFLAKGSS